MFRKIFCTFLIGMTLSNPTSSKTFSIVANSNTKEDIAEMYQYKNEIIGSYQEMITGVSEDEVMEDLTLLYPQMNYENNQLVLVIGEGKGKRISGELKKDYCEVDVKPKSFIGSLFE